MFYLLQIAWGPRSWSVDDCAIRIAESLAFLTQQHDLLRCWYTTGPGRVSILPNDVPQIRKIVETGVNRKDSDKSIIQSLGYQISLWNLCKGETDMVLLDFHLSSTFMMSSGIANLVTLQIPASVASIEVALPILRFLDSVFEPQVGWLCQKNVLHSVRRAKSGPLVGWMTLLPKSVVELLPSACNVRVIELEHSSNVVLIAEAENIIAVADAIRSLAATGSLEIIP